MNYNNIKTQINAQIRENGNQEITGAILNSVLLNIVSGGNVNNVHISVVKNIAHLIYGLNRLGLNRFGFLFFFLKQWLDVIRLIFRKFKLYIILAQFKKICTLLLTFKKFLLNCQIIKLCHTIRKLSTILYTFINI